jgi:hypothetical protein
MVVGVDEAGHQCTSGSVDNFGILIRIYWRGGDLCDLVSLNKHIDRSRDFSLHTVEDAGVMEKNCGELWARSSSVLSMDEWREKEENHSYGKTTIVLHHFSGRSHSHKRFLDLKISSLKVFISNQIIDSIGHLHHEKYYSPFSAQKSHVKPQNRITPDSGTR